MFKPAFETETTTEYAFIASQSLQSPLKILDLGTGTGCILISLLKQLPNATGVGVDNCEVSLKTAQQNALTHGVGDRARFLYSNWTENIIEKFDIIVSNPPRIPSDLVKCLVKEVSEYDPRNALDGGNDGLYFYRALAQDFRRIATSQGIGIIQVGNIIAEKAVKTFKNHRYAGVELKRDYKCAPNCIVFQNCDIKRVSKLGRLTKFWGIRA